MGSKRNLSNSRPFSGPPYRDTSPGLFQDLNKAWQSIDLLKAELRKTENKLQIASNEPLGLESFCCRNGNSAQENNEVSSHSKSSGQPKRKIFRLEDKIKLDSSSNVVPNGEISAFEAHRCAPSGTKSLQKRDHSHGAERSRVFFVPEAAAAALPAPSFLNVEEFAKLKKTLEAANAQSENQYSDISLVPIKILNDRLPVSPSPHAVEDHRPPSLYHGPKSTRLDVHVTRPPKPPQTDAPHWDQVPHRDYLSSATATRQPSTKGPAAPPPGGSSPPVKMAWEPVQAPTESFTSLQRLKNDGLNGQPRNAPIPEPDADVKVKSFPVIRKVSSEAVAPSGYPGFSKLRAHRPKSQIEDGGKHSSPVDSNALTTGPGPPRGQPERPQKSSNEDQGTMKNFHSRRSIKQKKVSCKSRKIEDYAINPFSWRKGNAIILKELGALKSNVPLKGKGALVQQIATEDHEEPSTTLRSVSQLPKDVQESTNDEECSAPKVPLQRSDVEAKLHQEKVGDAKLVPSSPKKPPKKKLAVVAAKASTQPTAKLRHYDQDSVRKYMKKQQADRKNKTRKEKIAQLSAKENQQEKLRELELKRKELAGNTTASARSRTFKRDGIGPYPVPSQLAWSYDATEPFPLKPSGAFSDAEMDDYDDDTDYIWEKVLHPQVPRRKHKDRKTLKILPAAWSTSASGNDDSSGRINIHPERKQPLMTPSVQKHIRTPPDGDQRQGLKPEVPANEKLQSLAILYYDKVDDFMSKMQTPTAPNYEEKESKIISIREKALRLQEAIDLETQRLKQELQLQQKFPGKDSSALNVVSQDSAQRNDLSRVCNIGQVVAELAKIQRKQSHRTRSNSQQSTISEGMLQSGEWTSVSGRASNVSKFLADIVGGRGTEARLLPAEDPKDWRALIPQETPDPYNFVSVLARKRASVIEDGEQDARIEESGSLVVAYSDDGQEKVNEQDYTSDFEVSSLKLSTSNNNSNKYDRSNENSNITFPSRPSKESKTVETDDAFPSSAASSASYKSTSDAGSVVKDTSYVPRREDSISARVESPLSSSSSVVSEQHLKNRKSVAKLLPGRSLDTVSTPVSSASLSQHSLPTSGPPSDADEQISEGVLSSLSDVSQLLGMSSPPRASADLEQRPLESINDAPAEKSSLLNSDLRLSKSFEVESSGNSRQGALIGQDNDGETFSKSNITSLSSGKDVSAAKMSPNTLRLRMSTELNYLDNVQESLGQLHAMERIRAVSLAQQEAVALAQVIQASQSEPTGIRPATADNNPNLQLLQSQTEVAKLSAEAAKQLAEINKTILAQHDTRRITESSALVTDTVAAAAAAAVTAAISQLKHKLQQSRNSRRARLDSSTGSRSSDQLTSTGESERSQGSSESSSSSSGHSQNRNSCNGNVSKLHDSRTVREERSKSTLDSDKVHEISVAQSVASSKNSIPEELSSGPLSPSVSEDINGVATKSRNEEPVSSKLDTSVTEEEVEERSFRMLLPSESHRRSSLGHRLQRTLSPASDLSKRSSVSDALSVSSEERASLSSGDILDDPNLFSGENSFQQFTLRMVRQYTKEEEMRAHHQNAILKIQEQALLEKTKAEIAWIKLQKRQCRIKGEDDKMPPLCKKQRTILTKLKHDKAEIKRLREAEKAASQERQQVLMQQEQDMASQQPPLPEPGRRSISTKFTSGSSSSDIVTEMDADLKKGDSASDAVLSMSERPSSSEIKSDLSAPDGDSDQQSDVQEDLASKSKSLVLPASPSTTQVLQGLKKLQISKRYLTKREQKLLQRRKNVEELLRWQQKLDNEELQVQEMERKALEILGDKRITSSNLDSQENSSPPASTTELENGKEVTVRDNTSSSAIAIDKSSSVVERISVEKHSSHVSTGSEVEEETSPSKDTTIKSATRSFNTESTLTRQATTLDTGSQKLTMSAIPNYSDDKFESSATNLSKDGKDDKSVEASASTVAAVSEQTSVKAKSVVLRSALTPLRTQTRRRRDSSGSEDSCTISQSETASEPSDIEGRIHALKRDLRQRRNEAERLRREQKRKNKERLKAQEASLLKQIEAYDRYILEAKLDLQKELEQVGQARQTVRPVIKQPKVAESKRLQRQLALEKSPEAEEKRERLFSDDKDGNSEHQSPISSANQDGELLFPVAEIPSTGRVPLSSNYGSITLSVDWPQLNESNVSSTSQPTSLESNEGSFDSVKGTSADGGDVAVESETIDGGDCSSATEETLKKIEGSETEKKVVEETVTTSSDRIKSTSEESALGAKSECRKVVEHTDDSVDCETEQQSGVATSGSVSSPSEVGSLPVPKNEVIVVSCVDSDLQSDFIGDDRLDDVQIAKCAEELDETNTAVDQNENEPDSSELKIDLESKDSVPPEDQPDIETPLIEEGEGSVSRVQKDERPAQVLVEGIVESLIQRLLVDLTRDIQISHFLNRSEKLRTSSDGRDVINESAKYEQGHRIADSLLETLLDESVLVALKIQHGSARHAHNGAKIAELEAAKDCPESYVRRRVTDILSEMGQEKKSPGTNTRTQDILVLTFPSTYNDDFSPPEIATSPPPPGSPVKSGIGSPVRRPSSPILGESTELGPAELEAQLLAVQTDADLLADQEWFDDDFGIGSSPPEDQPPIQHYQIYPYQDSYYIREIPNKPPPPYTPPGQALSPSPTNALSPLTSTLNGTSDFGGRSTGKFFPAVSYDEAEMKHLVGKAAEFFYEKVVCRRMPPDKEEPDDFFTEDDRKEDIGNRSHRSYARFVLGLTEDVVRSVYEHGQKRKRPPWLKPEWPAKQRKAAVPNSLEQLVPLVQNKVLELVVKQRGTCARASTSHLLKWGRKKRDFVDEILLRELQREEAEWVTYDEDEVAVKMQLTDSIFDELIAETVSLVKDVFQKKYGHENH